jgi:hypothetical protein
MPEPSNQTYAERLRAAAKRLADKINNSSAGKAVERQFEPAHPGQALQLKALKVGDSEASKTGSAIKPKVNEDTARAAVRAIAQDGPRAAKPSVRALYDLTATPRHAAEVIAYAPEGGVAEHYRRQAIAEEVARRKAALTSGN